MTRSFFIDSQELRIVCGLLSDNIRTIETEWEEATEERRPCSIEMLKERAQCIALRNRILDDLHRREWETRAREMADA